MTPAAFSGALNDVVVAVGVSDATLRCGQTAATQRDVPALDTSVHDESDRGLPELRHLVQIRAVKRALEPHCGILLLYDDDAEPEKSLTCALTQASPGGEACSDWMPVDCFAG